MPYQKTKEGRLVNEITLGDGYPLSNDLQPLKIGGEASVIEISHPLPDGSDNGLFKVNGDLDITGTLKTKLSHDLIYDFDDEVNTLAQAKVDALIDSAPAALDTLNELAAALGDDANFATTVTNSIATKLPLAGGTLTGDLTINAPASKLILSGDDTSENHEIESDANLYLSIDKDADDTNNFFQFRANSGGTLKNIMRLQDDGNVGIGTTSPSRELHIYRNNIYAAVEIQGSSKSLYMGGNWGIGYTTSTDLEFKINNSTQMIIDSGARVGIGTTSPSVKLDVEESSVSALIDIHQSASGTGTDSGIRFQKNSNLKGTVGYNAGTDTVNLNYGAFDNTHLNIDSSGNVGIGTTSPTEALDVTGNIHCSGSLTADSLVTASLISHEGDTNTLIAFGTDTVTIKAGNEAFITIVEDGTQDNIQIGDGGDIDINLNTQLFVEGSSGNVGIGNTSPNHLLHVGDDATAAFVTNPDKAIQLSSTTNDEEIAYILYSAEGSNNIRSKYFIDDDIQWVGWDSTYSSGLYGYKWQIAGNDKMALTSAGNLGIGTSSPAEKLHVVGNLKVVGNISSVSGGASIGDSAADVFRTTGHTYLATVDNNVGIGTTSPTTKLDVEGTVSYKHTAFSTAGPTDNIDVSDTTVLEVDTSSNNVIIGGFTGGVQGQILYIVKTNTANFIQLEHNEGGGSQDIFITTGSDERVVGYGGYTLYCNGTSWFSLSNPTGGADAG